VPSPWTGFHRRSREERLALVARHAGLGPKEVRALGSASGLGHRLAGTFIENAAGAFPLPLGFAVGFVVDGVDTVVPMAVEESSVVAAASHGAKMAAAGGGFETEASEPVTIGQVELRDVRDPAAAARAIRRNAARWMRELDALIPGMVRRGGGMRAIVPRPLPGRLLAVHLHVDTRDAMGANVANTLCEAAAPAIAEAVGGGARVGLRILSNLGAERLAEARCSVPVDAVGGAAVARRIVEANRFAEADPYRAATHNKGIFNGIDPVAVATGNDWRAIEAGGHAWAARGGRYGPLTSYSVSKGRLNARLSLPLAVGTVGGVTRLHPTAAACLKVLGSPDARRLARVMAAVGLAQNLAALRALSAEGIQAGHMRLHEGNLRILRRPP
jgi:hydroxymethylglutaryl-CoA reductase